MASTATDIPPRQHAIPQKRLFCKQISPVSGNVYLEVPQPLGHHVRPYFLVMDHVAAVLGMAAHGPGAGAFVVPVVDHFGCEREAAETAEERGGGLHRNPMPGV